MTSTRRFAWFSLALVLVAALALIGYLAGRRIWADYHWRAAQQALERHDLVEAQAHLTKYLKVHPTPEALLLAARTARRAGFPDRAAQYLDDCEGLRDQAPAVAFERALLSCQRGDLPAEVEGQLWFLVNQNHPQALLILEALAQGYMYSYRLDSAMDCLQRWLQVQPDSIQALLWRAQVWQGMQRYGDALTDYRRALDLNPDYDEARLQLAVFLAYSGRPAEAVEHFERVLPRQPKNPTVLLGLARCREDQNRLEEADQLLDSLLSEFPDSVPALRQRGKIAFHLGRTADAENWLRKCLAQDSADQEAMYLLSRCLQEQGKKEEAAKYLAKLKQVEEDLRRLEQLNKAVGQDPHNPNLRQQAAVICFRNGQEQEALRWLAGALQIDPRHQPTHQLLADYYQRLGQLDQAAHHRRFALPANSDR